MHGSIHQLVCPDCTKVMHSCRLPISAQDWLTKVHLVTTAKQHELPVRASDSTVIL